MKYMKYIKNVPTLLHTKIEPRIHTLLFVFFFSFQDIITLRDKIIIVMLILFRGNAEHTGDKFPLTETLTKTHTLTHALCDM